MLSQNRPARRLLAWALPAAAAPAQPILYVNHAAPQGGNGLTWETAFDDLQAGLDAAAASGGTITQLWVAAGTYTPDRGTHDRLASFHLLSGLAIYGGFADGETDLGQRDPAAHPTVLSADLLGNDGPNFANTSDNAYHVVTAAGTHATAVLDGFIVQAGNAPDIGGDNSVGGGLSIKNGSARIVNCRFSRNRAMSGGGLYCFQSSPLLIRCTFEGNAAFAPGGAVFNNQQCDPVFVFCAFSGNTAGLQGGAIANTIDCNVTLLSCGYYGNRAGAYGGGAVLNNNSNTTLANCVFSGNVASGTTHTGSALRNEHGLSVLINCTLYGNSAGTGGGIFNFNVSTASLANCVLWANTDNSGSGQAGQITGDGDTPTLSHCCVQGWTGSLGGTGNFGYDPVLANPVGADGILGTSDDLPRPDGCHSPCTNTGDTAEPLPLDLTGDQRVFDGRVDRGAYEAVAEQCLRGNLNCDGVVNFADINPFVVALSGEANIYAQYPNCNWFNADCNGDRQVNFADINVFVAILGGG